ATAFTPNVMGTARRTRPRGATDCASASFSAASPSASRRSARPANFCPASVKASRREVRLNSRAPRRSSSRVTAFETVAFDSASSPAAAANDRSFTTFAKIAMPSKSGSFAMGRHLQARKWKQCVSIVSIYARPGSAYPEVHQNFRKKSHDRTQTIFKTRRRRPRLAQSQTPFLIRQSLRPRQYGPRFLAGVERRRDLAEHRLSPTSPCQHGDHHLRSGRRDYPSG